MRKRTIARATIALGVLLLAVVSLPRLRLEYAPDVTFPELAVTLQLPIAGVTAAVEVGAHQALIDVHSSAITTIVDEPMLHDVPTDRTLRSVLSLAPGVTTTPTAW